MAWARTLTSNLPRHYQTWSMVNESGGAGRNQCNSRGVFLSPWLGLRCLRDCQVENRTAGVALFDAVDLALRIRRDKFSVNWDDSAGFFSGVQWTSAPSEMTLDQLAERALAGIRVAAFGAKVAAPPVINPFTISTTVRGAWR